MSFSRFVGETIRAERKRQGIQAQELAARVPVSRSHLSAIELDQRLTSLPMLDAIVNALDLEMSEFLILVAEKAR
jgi:transcriptional regulator with XRE-family HTH domain